MDTCSPTVLKLLSVHDEFMMKNDSVVVSRLHLRARGRTVPVTKVTSWVCFMLSFPLNGFMVPLHLRFVETTAIVIMWTIAILLYWVNTNCNQNCKDRYRTYF